MILSVIIPYWNGEQWIATCLDSLLRQDLSAEDYEIIVVDDGSTHSIDTLNSYVNAYPQIHYLHQENQKHAAARNYGLTIARGDYVLFCDCDDFVTDHVLGRLCEIAQEEMGDVLLFNVCSIQENETIAAPKRDFDNRSSFESGLAYMSQPPYHFQDGVWRFLIRRSFMEETHLRFAPEMINREEYLFFLQMMLSAGKVIKVDADVYYYVQHPTSWVYSTGMVNHSHGFINCMITYLTYLHQTRLELTASKHVSTGLLKAMRHGEAEDAYAILHKALRYSTISYNKKVIRELKDLGFYPIQQRVHKYDFLRQLMNIYPLWVILCCCYHLLPQSLVKCLVKILRKKDKSCCSLFFGDYKGIYLQRV